MCSLVLVQTPARAAGREPGAYDRVDDFRAIRFAVDVRGDVHYNVPDGDTGGRVTVPLTPRP